MILSDEIDEQANEAPPSEAHEMAERLRARQVLDETPYFILNTTFDSNTLHLNLQLFNHEDQRVYFFELYLTNNSLPEEISKVFDSVTQLWEICFFKKENYTIQDNGRLRIDYKAHLRSDLRRKELFLNLLPVQRTETDMLRVYCRKVTEDSKKTKEEMKKIKNKFEAYSILKNDYSHSFTLDWDIVHYKNTSHQRTMLCFSTAIVDTEKFDFSVTTIEKSYYYWVGVIAEKSVKLRHSDGAARICCFNVGQLYKNATKIKNIVIANPPNPQGTSDCVRVSVDRRNKTVSFHLDNGQGQTATEKTNLSNLSGQGKLIPFIEFQSIGEYSVRINLT